MKNKLIVSIMALLFCSCSRSHDKVVIIQRDTIYVETEWSRLVSALIKVESNGNDNAVNEVSGASGCLQLMPIYVAEANRLTNGNYTLEDRFDRIKSIEMFNIIQMHHNKHMDIEKAIKLHNPGAGQWYTERVLKQMEE